MLRHTHMSLYTFPVGNNVPHHPEVPDIHSECSSHKAGRFEDSEFSTFLVIYLLLNFYPNRRHILSKRITYRVL